MVPDGEKQGSAVTCDRSDRHALPVASRKLRRWRSAMRRIGPDHSILLLMCDLREEVMLFKVTIWVKLPGGLSLAG